MYHTELCQPINEHGDYPEGKGVERRDRSRCVIGKHSPTVDDRFSGGLMHS